MLARLENLRLRAIALRSSVHNEHQLSAIELTAMSAKKTNEIIEVVNELCAVVNNLIENNGLLINYDEVNENLEIKGVVSQ